MTASEIAKLLHAKRAGTGKWMAKCPSHRDRLPSLSIREGKKCVSIHCFRGCDAIAILGTIGLSLSALYPDGRRDREAERLAEKMRAEAELKRKADRKLERDRIDLAWKWETVRNALGLLLIQRPDDDKLSLLFNHSCDMTRNLPSARSVLVPSLIQPGEVFPALDPMKGINARSFGAQITRYLRIDPYED